jgi:hypothetical protein
MEHPLLTLAAKNPAAPSTKTELTGDKSKIKQPANEYKSKPYEHTQYSQTETILLRKAALVSK